MDLKQTTYLQTLSNQVTKMKTRLQLRLNELEQRAMPANFFVSPVSLAVTDALGATATDTVIEMTAVSVSNTDFAVSLATGDKLIFDANFNRKFDVGDTVLASVKTGQAMAFMEDANCDGVFPVDEFLGLAVSDGFSANVFAINLDVVTALLPDGSLAFDGTNRLVL